MNCLKKKYPKLKKVYIINKKMNNKSYQKYLDDYNYVSNSAYKGCNSRVKCILKLQDYINKIHDLTTVFFYRPDINEIDQDDEDEMEEFKNYDPYQEFINELFLISLKFMNKDNLTDEEHKELLKRIPEYYDNIFFINEYDRVFYIYDNEKEDFNKRLENITYIFGSKEIIDYYLYGENPFFNYIYEKMYEFLYDTLTLKSNWFLIEETLSNFILVLIKKYNNKLNEDTLDTILLIPVINNKYKIKSIEELCTKIIKFKDVAFKYFDSNNIKYLKEYQIYNDFLIELEKNNKHDLLNFLDPIESNTKSSNKR